MVSDQEIASCVESFLRQPADPNRGATIAAVTVNGVVQQVEAKLGLDLSHKTAFIRDHINLLLSNAKHQHAVQPISPNNNNDQHFPYHQLHHLPQQQQLHSPQQHHYYPSHFVGQVTRSPFVNLPQSHELAFQSSPPAQMIHPHHYQHPHHSQMVTLGATSMQKQEASLTSTAAAITPKGSQTGAKRRGGPGGLSKICGVSPELQAIVGEPALPRTQIVKQLWAYIRKHNLQDPNNKRKIVCNDELRLVFETDCTDMFKMNKLLAKHIIPLEPTKESGSDSKRMKASEATPDELETAESAVTISEALASFFGTEKREMLQSDVLNRVWHYIKTNQLEDPLKTPMVICDAKLQQLLGCEKLASVGISEMVSRHFVKQSLN